MSMWWLSLGFLLTALITAVLGFAGLPAAAAGIARELFAPALAFFLISVIASRAVLRSLSRLPERG